MTRGWKTTSSPLSMSAPTKSQNMKRRPANSSLPNRVYTRIYFGRLRGAVTLFWAVHIFGQKLSRKTFHSQKLRVSRRSWAIFERRRHFGPWPKWQDFRNFDLLKKQGCWIKAGSRMSQKSTLIMSSPKMMSKFFSVVLTVLQRMGSKNQKNSICAMFAVRAKFFFSTVK